MQNDTNRTCANVTCSVDFIYYIDYRVSVVMQSGLCIHDNDSWRSFARFYAFFPVFSFVDAF